MTDIILSISKLLEESVKVPVVCEVEGDVEKRLKLSIGKQTICVLLSFNGLAPDKQAAGVFIGKAEIVASVFERPVVNRSRKGEPHLLDVAEDVRRALTYFKPDGAASGLFYRRTSSISEVNSEIGGVITCDVVFDLKTNN